MSLEIDLHFPVDYNSASISRKEDEHGILRVIQDLSLDVTPIRNSADEIFLNTKVNVVIGTKNVLRYLRNYRAPKQYSSTDSASC